MSLQKKKEWEPEKIHSVTLNSGKCVLKYQNCLKEGDCGSSEVLPASSGSHLEARPKSAVIHV